MTMRRGDEIEVYSCDNCYKRWSWSKAILEEDALPQSGNKKLNVSLLAAGDGSNTRTSTYRRFIRPVPPEYLFTAVDFEEGCVVGASKRGGWWTGVVVKKINHEKVLVYFGSPPDLFQIKTSQLRQHFVWERQEWVRPRNKVLSKKSPFGCGTMVEVKVMDGDDDDVWVPSVIVKELENGKSFIVKPFKNLSWNDGGEVPKPNMTVGSSSIRLTPPRPPVSVERYGLMESVEVFLEPGWRPGMVTSILCEDRYTVCLKATNQSLVFKHSALRPSGESITKSFLQNTTRVNAANTPQTSLSSEENGEKEVVPEEHNKEDDSRKRKRGKVEHNPDLSETAANESVSLLSPSQARTQGMAVQPVSKQSGVENHTTQENESCEEGNNIQAKDTIVVVLPFAKKSPLWKELETMEVFQRAPQQSPHLSPVAGESEEFREGQAFGMMLTLSRLLENFKDLEPDVSMSELDSLKVSFTKLEKHSFNVSAPLARINKLLAIKGKQLMTMEEQKGLDRQMMALKQEFGDMQHKLIELERQQEALKELSEAAYQNLCQMESCSRDRGLVLDNLKSEFEATSSAPWGEI